MALTTSLTVPGILRWLLSVTTTALLLGGCAGINLVPDYDPILDETVSKLQADTSSFFEKLRSGKATDQTYAANKGFYDQAFGTVDALHTRAEALEKDLRKKILTENFDRLREQYVDLSALHKTNPPAVVLSSARAAFDQTFRAILFHIRALKTGNTGSTAT